MHKSDLVNEIAKGAKVSKNVARGVLEICLESITNALQEKDSVSLLGFGTFSLRERAERKGKNPQTGNEITIKASNTVAFKPGKYLKEAVNE